MRKFLAVFVTAIILIALPAGIVRAQGDDPPPTPHPDEVNAIAKNLYCPVCESIPLDVCGTPACAQWRQQIADLLVQGYSEQQIYDYFAMRYGDGVLAAPPARGANLVVYVLPVGAIFIAAMVVWRSMRKSRFAGMQRKVDNVSSKHLAQIERDLENRW